MIIFSQKDGTNLGRSLLVPLFLNELNRNNDQVVPENSYTMKAVFLVLFEFDKIYNKIEKVFGSEESKTNLGTKLFYSITCWKRGVKSSERSLSPKSYSEIFFK